MKTFEVKHLLYHESFNGYDLCDGWETHIIEARNEKSAKKKAAKLKPWGYWIQNTTIAEIKK